MLKAIKRFIKRTLFIVGRTVYWPIFVLFAKKPKVLTPEETIRQIVDKELSVSRFGEGEFKLMSKRGKIGFQDLDNVLSQKLLDAFALRNENLMVCSYNFSLKRPMRVESGRWLKDYVYIYYKHLNFFDFKHNYGDTDISRFYQPDCYKYTDYEYLKTKYIPLLKTIWEGKKILLVEGFLTKLGLGNDLFSNSLSVRRIECPPRNAFTKYDQIKSSILNNIKKDEIVLLALGPTASVLSADLCCNHNIRAIDIGHVDVVYMWFLNKTKTKYNIEGKYVNEANEQSATIKYFYDKEKYQKEIIDIIG